MMMPKKELKIDKSHAIINEELKIAHVRHLYGEKKEESLIRMRNNENCLCACNLSSS